jgi:Transglycosylase SLT domain
MQSDVGAVTGRLRLAATSVVIAAGILFCGSAHAENARQSLCLMLESAAEANQLPLPFFARVIWRESHFDPNAVGPRTRSGEHAQGIAQFMPGTAAEHGLDNPFDPIQALPKAAAFLSRLREQFGNLGLAAAAYNAGPARIQGWLAGTRSMPAETSAYVEAITGRSVEDWAKEGSVDMVVPKTNCERLVASLGRQPNGFVYDLQEKIKTALSQPWGVLLAAGFSRERVLAHYSRVMEKAAALIGSHDPILTVSHRRGLSAFYQAWIGTETLQAAESLCGKMRATGGACIVLRAQLKLSPSNSTELR